MELSGYLRLLRAHWVALVIAIFLGGVVALGWAALQPKVYTADASGILTTGVSTDLNSALVGDTYAKSRVKSYLDVAKSRAVAEYAIKKLSLNESPDALVGAVSVTNPDETAVLQVTANAGTPIAARNLAETWMDGMIAQVTDLENTGEPDTADAVPGAPTDDKSIVKLQTLDSAVLPSSPTSPNRELALILGVVIGLALGIIYAFVRRSLDRRIRSVDGVEKEFHLPVVGAIPFNRNFSDSDRIAVSTTEHDAHQRDDDGVSEAMRELRTNLQFMDVDNPPRIIVITSSLPGDGKSTITANLATTIAASGQQVIVVDGDLRRPTVAKAFGLLPGVGLTDVLVGRAEISDVLQEWGHTGRLLVMGAGSLPPNPSELLGSKAMESLLNDLARQAIVLVDAPPLIPVTDAAILTARSDGALIVASAGRTSTDALGKSLQNLERVKGRPLGVILNRMRRRGAESGYYGYKYKGDYTAHSGAPEILPEDVPQPATGRRAGRRASAAIQHTESPVAPEDHPGVSSRSMK